MPLTNQNIATTQGSDSYINQNPQGLVELQTGVGAQNVHLIGDQYMIDIYADLTRHEPYKTPLLTIVSGLGSESWKQGPYVTWNDDYNGKMWHDLHLDSLRLANDGDNNTAGQLVFQNTSSDNMDEVTASSGIVTLCFDQTDDDILGSKKDVVLTIANLLNNAGYQPQKYDDTWTNTSDGDQYKYTANEEDYPVYLAFEDILYNDTSADYQEHEIIAKIKSIAWNTGEESCNFADGYGDLVDIPYTFVLEIDFNDSNIENYDDGMKLNLQEVDETASFGTSGYTRLARVGLIAPHQGNTPDAIAEGSTFSAGKGWNFSVQNLQNKCQIFASDKYGITGTRQAATARFFDEFQRTRERNLNIYKARQNVAYIRGVQSETFDTDTGKPKRKMSGLLDYSTFPIKYIKESIDGIKGTSGDRGSELADWIDNLVYSVQAFKEGNGSDTVTFLTSNWVLKQLTRANAYIGTDNGGNVFGSFFTTKPPSKLTLGLRVFEYNSLYGTVRFIHDPALDLMPSLGASTATQGGVPNFLFSSGINPQKMLIALDKKYIKSVVYRPDKIHGNIQDIGQDSFEEAMRGEKSFKLKFPRNHAIIDVS